MVFIQGSSWHFILTVVPLSAVRIQRRFHEYFYSVVNLRKSVGRTYSMFNAWIEMLHIWKNNNTGVVKQSNLDCPNIADSLECSIFAYLSLLSPFFLCFQQTRVFWEEEEVSKHLLVCLFFIISLPVPTVLKQLKLHSSDLTRRICILLRHHRILECVFRSECPC